MLEIGISLVTLLQKYDSLHISHLTVYGCILLFCSTDMNTRILIFGTYDGIHEGHRHFFAQARALAPHPYLIVSLARDINVLKVKSRPPHDKEAVRKKLLEQEPLIDEVILGAQGDDYIEHICALKPDIIALGYDQDGTVYTNALREKLSNAHCNAAIVRCDPYKPETYKSSKIQR